MSVLTDPSRRTNRGQGRIAANLLSGIATCARCGETVSGGTVGRTARVDGRRVSTGQRVPVYKCPSDHISTPREDVDSLVTTAFVLTMMVDSQPDKLMPVRSNSIDASALRAQSERLDAEISALANSFTERRITLEQMEIATAGLQAQKGEIERTLADDELGNWDIKARIHENASNFDALDTNGKRAILSRLARIVLYPKGRGNKSVPIKHQVTMDLVTEWEDGTERVIPALRERPSDLPPVNVQPQTRLRAR